jgi:formamidopyrimidine-DNA glycosylase
VIANASPHKFAWYMSNPMDYPKKLKGKTIAGAEYFSNHVEIRADELRVVINPPMRYHSKDDPARKGINFCWILKMEAR